MEAREIDAEAPGVRAGEGHGAGARVHQEAHGRAVHIGGSPVVAVGGLGDPALLRRGLAGVRRDLQHAAPGGEG